MARMKWTEAKSKGLCTRCNVNKAEGKRMILCGVCRGIIGREHEAEGKPKVEGVKYITKDTSGDRG